jgi:hypothetical protein
MNKTKITFVVLLALAAITLAFFAGYRTGWRVDDRRHLTISLNQDVYLYHEVESGNFAAVKSSLGFFICGRFTAYEQRFGDEPFLHFDEARQIAAIAATNGDVVWSKK